MGANNEMLARVKNRSTAKLAIELMKKGSHGKLNLPNKKNHENPTRILH
jgi:hypothetical protein